MLPLLLIHVFSADQPSFRPTDTDRPGHREFSLPIKVIWGEIFFESLNEKCYFILPKVGVPAPPHPPFVLCRPQNYHLFWRRPKSSWIFSNGQLLLKDFFFITARSSLSSLFLFSKKNKKIKLNYISFDSYTICLFLLEINYLYTNAI